MSEKEKKLQATALKYDANTDAAPYIVGVGQGHVAEAMVRAAEERNIPVVEDEGISTALKMLGIGDDIPAELYQVIAEVLVFITRLDGDRARQFGLTESMLRR